MTSRRNFLQRSAAAAATLTLGPLAGEARAESPVHDAASGPVANRMRHARPVPLERVRVTGGPLKHAQELTASYLLALNPDSMMAPVFGVRMIRA